MKRSGPGLLFALALSAWAHAAPDAGPMSLEDALAVQVSGASRFMQPLSEAPADVTVISAEDVRRFGYRTLADALQSAPGVYATDGRDYTYLGIRGLGRLGDYNTRIVLLADGMRRNDPIYDQAMLGNEAPLDIDWVKQVEFVPGAASALYGGNALFGIANAVLWSGADLQGTRSIVGVGSEGTSKVSLLSGRRLDDGTDWVFGISTYRRQGDDIYFREYDVPGVSDGVARGLDGERYVKAFAKYLYGDWRVGVSYSGRRQDVPTAYYGTLFNVPGNYVADDTAYVDISHSANIGTDWNRYARFSLGAYRFDSQYVYPGLTAREESSARWWDAEYRLTYSGLAAHRVMAGVEAQVVPHLLQQGHDVETASFYLDDRRIKKTTGIFAQDEWRLAPLWTFDMGARIDHLPDYGSVFSPRLALIYAPHADTSIKLIHGSAFRPANAYERFYNDAGASQKANPDLLPERIVSNELVVKFPLTATVHGGANLYQYRLDHLIDQITDPSDGLQVFVNSPTLHARGLELSAETVLPSRIRLAGSIGWQQLRQDFDHPANSPQRLLKVRADGPLFDTEWKLGFTAQGISRRATLAGYVPGYVNSNLMLRHALPKHAGELSLGIYNLANRHYLDPAQPELVQDALPSDGRQMMLRWEGMF